MNWRREGIDGSVSGERTDSGPKSDGPLRPDASLERAPSRRVPTLNAEKLLDYAATKAVNANFTKALAKQHAGQGIRVNGVAPGPIWTPLQPSGGQFPDDLPDFGANTPMGRAGQPAELAALYVLLASDEASFSTGQIFGAVGGRGGP